MEANNIPTSRQTVPSGNSLPDYVLDIIDHANAIVDNWETNNLSRSVNLLRISLEAAGARRSMETEE